MSAIRRIGILGLVVAVAAVAGLVLYVGLFRSPIFRSEPILFYRGLMLAAVDAVLLATAFVLLGRRMNLADPAIVLAATMTSLSINLTFLIVIPVTIDRSVSVFLLSRIEAAPPAAPLDARSLRTAFVRDYVVGMAQVDRRIDEQRRSGNVSVTDGQLGLTSQGRRFMRLSRALSGVFGTDPRFVGEPPRSARAQPLQDRSHSGT